MENGESMKLDEEKVKEFFKILRGRAIKPVFQPIVSLSDGEILSYEALSRITLEKATITIDKLFDMADRLGQVWNLEKLCRSKALKAAAKKPEHAKLFLNVDANIILDDEFVQGFTKEFLEKYELTTQDIVFELTERTSVEDKELFQRVVNHYKGQGFEIAIDDAGSGYSNLNRISCVEPQYIKIDMELIRNIHLSKAQKSMVRIMERLCRELNYVLIAEGIETEEELRTLIELGVPYGQGYYFQKPSEEFMDIPKKVKNKISELQKEVRNHTEESNSCLGSIESICKAGFVMTPDRKAVEAYELFDKNNHISQISIVDENGSFFGMLTRNAVIRDFGGMYGYTLHQKYRVSDLMKCDPLIVNVNCSVEQVSKQAMERPSEEVYDAVVVLKNDKYYGIVTIKDLLSAAIAIQIKRAADANPLTALPGNMTIERKIEHLSQEREPYTIMYLDLDNFKAYNDSYGFQNGDRMIKALADSMKQACAKEDFLGHVGGDDFVVITRNTDAKALGEQIIAVFRTYLKSLYNETDWNRGYIVSQDRKGVIEQFPIASVSIAVVAGRKENGTETESLSERIAAAKKAAKKQSGNSVVAVS